MSITTRINSFENHLDYWLPNHSLQIALDDFREGLSSYFVYPKEAREYEQIGAWHEQAIVFFSSLPHKIASNIVRSLNDIAYVLSLAVLYPLSHPLKTPFELIKLAARALEELSKTENWIKLGASPVGSAIGYSVITPINPIAFSIGMAMLSVGVTAKLLLQTQISISQKISQSLQLMMTAAATSICSWYALGNAQHVILRNSVVS